MKTFSQFALCLALLVNGGHSQTISGSTGSTGTTGVPPPTTPQVVNAGPSHNVWQWQTYEQLANGQIATHVHSYTELASGLNRQNPASGQWIPSQALIEPYAQGAIAQRGQHQVIFANNLNSSGAIDEQTPDGKRLTSNIIALMYDDPTTGQSVQIAGIQDCEGQLIATNEVLYTNAFNGVRADVLFTYRLDGMEQDVILRAQLPAPEAYGLNSGNVELVAVTEFVNPPAASVWDMGTDPQGLEPDEAIGWGATTLGRGRAFSLGGEDVSTTVIKQYANVNGRYFLYEKVRLRDIQQALSSLPQQASNAHRLPGMASRHPRLPKALKSKPVAHPIRLALGSLGNKGYVLDYVSLNTAYTNFTFQGDTTYYVSGNVNLSGTNYFEGNTVIKYAANASITGVAGSVMNFLSAPYRPVVFTAKDDNVMAETISGSTGTPSGYYANPALNLASMGSLTLSDFRIAYANRGLSVPPASTAFYDAQLVNCATGVSDISGPVSLENVLLSNVKTNFNAATSANTISIQNATFNNAFNLVNGFTNTSFYLTNCAFVNVTNLSGYIFASYNGFYRSPTVGSESVTATAYPLQRAGAADCYFTNTCAFLNAGTTNISPMLLADLAGKTIYPPIIYSNTTIPTITAFSPQAGRDYIGNPDLGYHYDPLDYVFGAMNASSNLTFAAGTAVGWFYNSSGGTYGLEMGDSATASFNGTVTAPCHLVRYSMVQESVNGNWTPQSWLTGVTGQSYTHAPPGMTAQFTIFSVPPGEAGPYSDNHSTLFVFTGNNCEFYSGGGGAYFASHNLTNCLFVNCAPGLWDNYGTANMTLENCTVLRGNLIAVNDSGGNWPICIVNTAFAGTTFLVKTDGGPTNGYYSDYNSFLLNSNTTPLLGSSDITNIIAYNWQSSWFGDFYLPSDSLLIDAGSTTADQIGLYHFTTQTSQTPEYTSTVDIGYHYVAADDNGNPLDNNGDGIPDYIEDANGNGLVDSGEIGWNIGRDPGLKVTITRPRNGSVLP